MSSDARIGIQVELAALRKQLAESGDLTGEQASRMVAALNKQMKAAEKAQLAAAKAAKEARGKIRELGDEYKQAGDAAGKFGQSGAKLAGILDLIDPRLAEVSRLANDLGDAGEVAADASSALGVSMRGLAMSAGVVGVALAGLAATYAILKREQDAAEAAAAARAGIATAMQASTTALKKARLELAAATGDAAAKERLLADETARTAAASWEGTIAAQREALRIAEERYGFEKKRNSEAKTVTPFMAGLERDAAAAMFQANRELQTSIRLRDEMAGVLAKTEGIRAGGGAAAAAKQEKDSLAEIIALAKERRDLYRDGLTTIREEAAAQSQERASAEERLSFEREAALVRIGLAAKVAAANGTSEERVGVAKARAEAEYQVELTFTEKIDALRDAAAAKVVERARAAAAEARQAGFDMTNAIAGYAQQALTAGSDAAGDASAQAAATARSLEEQLAASEQHLTEAQKAELQKRAAAAKDAALEQFNTSKNLKMAEATAAAALAVINQLASNPGPAGVAAAIAAGAAGATSLAAIGATQLTLHKGGEVMAPDEVGVTARRNEFMLTPTGRSTLGSDTELNRANAGVSPRSAPTYVVTQYQHSRIATRYKEDGIKRNDPVSQAIQKRLGPVGME
jgi:hypothetical protein